MKINQFTNNPWWFTSNSGESTLTAVKARALLYSAVKGRQRGGPTIIYRENTFCAKFCLQQPLKVGPADFQKLMYKQRWRKRQWSREAITWLGKRPTSQRRTSTYNNVHQRKLLNIFRNGIEKNAPKIIFGGYFFSQSIKTLQMKISKLESPKIETQVFVHEEYKDTLLK